MSRRREASRAGAIALGIGALVTGAGRLQKINSYLKAPFLLSALGAAAVVFLPSQAAAQPFATLHSFSAMVSGENADGAKPYGGVIISGSTLYGTASAGGALGSGTVFAIGTDGTGFTNLHSLTRTNDGSSPYAGLLLSDATLYGTTTAGGDLQSGTVFAVSTNGTGFTNVHTFSAVNLTTGQNSDGANLYGALIISGKTLYGTANKGGSSGVGTIFAVNTDGSGFTNLHNFNGGNGQGVSPFDALVCSGGILYGTTLGPFSGLVFAMNTDGTGFTNLHKFTGLDGSSPYSGLVLSGGTLYGTTYQLGPNGKGTVFALNTDGTGFRTLHGFTQAMNTNSDGANPYAGLILSRKTLYGTTYAGGTSGNGTVFAVNTDGTGFTNLHSFSATPSGTNSDGAKPYGGLILSGNSLYGTTTAGGSSGNGTIFSISLPVGRPQLGIAITGNSVILTWPTNSPGFMLQSATSLDSPVWITNSPGPVVVKGQNTVTTPISGRQQFFRLSQ